jgi:hypothetical protein
LLDRQSKEIASLRAELAACKAREKRKA